jgi:hypothetical protein
MEMGAAVTRAAWQGTDMYLRLQRPDANSLMTVPYVYVAYPTENGLARMPYNTPHVDMAADDWDYYDLGASK